MKHHAWKFGLVTGLTLGRAPLVLLWMLITLLVDTREHPFWYALAFASLVLAAATDLFDGYFARRFDIVTKLGEYADPLTDKIYYATTLPTLVYVAWLRGHGTHAGFLVFFAVILLLRDQWVSFLRSIGALYNMSGKANWSGKWRTIISFTAICCIYWYFQHPPGWMAIWPWVIYLLEAAAVVITLISIYVYTAHYWPSLKSEMAAPLKNHDDS